MMSAQHNPAELVTRTAGRVSRASVTGYGNGEVSTEAAIGAGFVADSVAGRCSPSDGRVREIA